MTASAAAVETVDLGKRFPLRGGWRSFFRKQGEKVALDRVALRIAPGEVFGLLGPNGAGKTTLVKILSSLVLPTTGRAYVCGLNVARHSREVRRRIGVIYGDERTFFWRLSVLENLRFYSALYGLPRRQAEARITDLLDFVGLTGDAHLPMHHFSTGMKQRAAIARGLLNDPEILFMDEPTRGLDPLASAELRRFVRERVVDGHRTVLLATNVMSEAEELCHRVAFLSQGRIQLIGSIEQLRTVLQTEDVYVLIVSHIDQAAIRELCYVSGVRSVRVTPLDHRAYRLELAVPQGSAAVPQVIRMLVNAGANIWSSTPQELSLESMFAMAVKGIQRPPLDGIVLTRPTDEAVPVTAGYFGLDGEEDRR